MKKQMLLIVLLIAIMLLLISCKTTITYGEPKIETIININNN